MPPSFSPHAIESIEERQIPREWIEQIIASPQQIVPEHAGRNAYQTQFIDETSSRPFLVRVIVEEQGGGLIVVTAYRTTKIAKYWRSE